MKIEVKSVDDSGNGYCIVHQDDGASFGQQFQGLPIDDHQAFNDALVLLAEQAVARQSPAQGRRVAPEILARIGVKVDVVPKTIVPPQP